MQAKNETMCDGTPCDGTMIQRKSVGPARAQAWCRPLFITESKYVSTEYLACMIFYVLFGCGGTVF